MMACDRVTGTANPWQELFSPDRSFRPGDLWDYLRENKDYPYYKMRDRFAGAASRSLRSIRRGHGAIIDRDGEKVAAFRDETGATTLRSANCTHMGCLVVWNDTERTWDCPCHGSRFKPNGDVLAGPAESPLDAVSQHHAKV
jgi:nitrite reductase/ring-hydroxylating ferredoxin subunit